jgi:alpha-D-ribose 1-methylphosphonate 5-triphosphate synthase subunit PhnG
MNTSKMMRVASTDPWASDRRAALAILVGANRDELDAAWQAVTKRPDMEIVRAPEIGLIMARGRTGGGGAPFNLGEVTVTRATVRLATGEVGIGHLLGRDRHLALLIARFDALWQNPHHRDFVNREVLAPIARRTASEERRMRRQTAATKVDFFTLVRGEDE